MALRRHRTRSADPGRRATGLLVVFGLLFLAVVVRLADVQVARSGRYVAYGEDRRIRSIELQAGRGALFDRNGNELAISIPTRTIYADPRLITDPEGTARRLARVLGDDVVDEAELADRLASDVSFTYVARQVDDGKAARVADLDLDGIDFVEEPKRYYPAGDLAASLLGRVDVDGDGVSGLEQRYDGELQGQPGELIREVDPDGNTIPAGRRQVDPAEPGDDLVLTIDRVLQHETERILADQIGRTGSKGGVAIVSNPRTGELLALANLEWDPETGRAVNTGNDTAVTANFEPGSVNKVITMAAALEEGIVTPETVMSVPDSLRVADHTFTDSHSHPTEDYSVTRILAESSNIGTIQIAQRVGAARLDDYLRRFGFGESTALGLPHEENGVLLDADDWSGTSIGAIPIGQGISVTAMQMLLAYNTIANDGVYQPPTLVSATVDEDGERHEAEPTEGRRVVSPTTARQVGGMLQQVVADGTGTSAAIEGYAVAGKTGTARKPQPGGGYVDENGRYRHVATFAGFLPAADPELSIIVVMDEPTSSPYAGDVAAPAFAEIGHYALRQMRIPPTELTAANTVAAAGQERVRSTPATTVAPPTSQPPTTQPATTVITAPGAPGTTVPGAAANAEAGTAATPPAPPPPAAAPPTTATPAAGAPPAPDPRPAATTPAPQDG
jgi:cell division protein FtsI (penicillin-binding protein 3)